MRHAVRLIAARKTRPCEVNRVCHILDTIQTTRAERLGIWGASVRCHQAAVGCTLCAENLRNDGLQKCIALGEGEACSSLAACQKEHFSLRVLLELLDDLPGALHHIQPFMSLSSPLCEVQSHVMASSLQVITASLVFPSVRTDMLCCTW